eukprot:TRINITY_DN3122_c0_g1_i6.p2 TRINITY_DN3122_c0_g1~~TRINITY_DN3122_c0_g1_i6.p2  ORF type:complete len:233 (+),score=-16.96 TRINITY_DN3122_c0_g1_i6:424-1122(+)
MQPSIQWTGNIDKGLDSRRPQFYSKNKQLKKSYFVDYYIFPPFYLLFHNKQANQRKQFFWYRYLYRYRKQILNFLQSHKDKRAVKAIKSSPYTVLFSFLEQMLLKSQYRSQMLNISIILIISVISYYPIIKKIVIQIQENFFAQKKFYFFLPNSNHNKVKILNFCLQSFKHKNISIAHKAKQLTDFFQMNSQRQTIRYILTNQGYQLLKKRYGKVKCNRLLNCTMQELLLVA